MNSMPPRYAMVVDAMALQELGLNMAKATMQPGFSIPKGIGLRRSPM
jgi:hypothetical protein